MTFQYVPFLRDIHANSVQEFLALLSNFCAYSKEMIIITEGKQAVKAVTLRLY